MQRKPRIRAGYIQVYEPDHPIARVDGYILEHRKNWYDANGSIPPGHCLHHKNGIRDDNRLENLELMTLADHGCIHGGNAPKQPTKRRSKTSLTCVMCGNAFTRLQSDVRLRLQNGVKTLLCSTRCSALYARRMQEPITQERIDSICAIMVRGENGEVRSAPRSFMEHVQIILRSLLTDNAR